MSRHTTTNHKGETVTYGYDNMLKEYFLYPDNEYEPEINNRHDIIDYLDRHGFSIPAPHLDNLLLDLPI